MGFFGDAARFVSDPLDLLGHRAGRDAAEEQLGAQGDALDAQKQEVQRTRNLLGSLQRQGRSDLLQQNDNAQWQLGQGYMGAAQDYDQLSRLQGQYTPGATTSVGSFTRPVNVEEDPGYQWRRQQGEEAILRDSAARGGRFGGSTLKALSDYNQGLASQEYGAAYNRMMGQAGMDQNAALQAQQNQMGLARLGYDAQAQGAQAQMQYGAGQAGLSSNLGANLGNLSTSTMGNQTALTQGMMGAQQNYAQYPGMVNQSEANQKGQMVGAAGGILGAIFSDVRLKTDIEPVPSKYERIGLRGFRWRWNQIAEALGLEGEAEGVIAQEVEQRYPRAVSRHPSGYLQVDYGHLDGLVGAGA